MAEGLLPPGTRFELYGGNILVMTPVAQWHFNVQVRLVQMLRDRGLIVGGEVGLRLGSRETRVLDVAVFRDEPDQHRAYFEADQIALAVEVVSPSTAKNDFREKPVLYAKLGIPEFWRVTESENSDGEDEYTVELFSLDERGRYALVRTASLDELETEGA